MKLYLLFATLCCQQIVEIATAPSNSKSASFKPSQHLASPLDSADKAAIAFLEKEAAREKRGSSGSGDILNHIKNSIGQGIKNKISQIAKSSAGASAYFSKSSSAHQPEHEHHGHHYPHYPPPPPPQYYPSHGHGYSHDDKPLDLWSIKKSVLYTLLQAVKAIKGGVIAIKGQLIKGGGHLLTAKGKLIRGGGEALSHLGKNIALSAFHWAPTQQEEEVVHEHHEAEEHPSAGYGYSAPSAGGHDVPPSAYGPPTGGAAYYHNSVYDGKTSPQQQQQHDGLIILRKIPKNLRHPDDTNADHTNDDQQHEDPHGHDHHAPHHAEYAHHEQDQPDGQESQKTPAFRPLSDGIVPKMKNLVTSVLQSSGAYPPNPYPYPQHPQSQHPQPQEPQKQPYDNTASHSLYNSHYNSKKQVPSQNPNKHIQPQQANIGSLANYLDYIRRQQKTTGKHSEGSGQNGEKVKSSVYVTPPPQSLPKTTKLPKHGVKPEAPKGGPSKVTQETIKQETVLLEQQLQQLASLQSLQHQLQMLNPYAQMVPQQALQPQHTPVALIQPEIPLGQPQLPQVLASQPQALNYEAYNSQGAPIMLDIPTNMDLASILTQYQIVSDTPGQNQPQLQPQQIQIIPQHLPTNNPQYLQDPMEEAESSQVNTFLIHVPDDDEQEARSLRHTTRDKPKSKRHLRPHSHHNPPSKLKKLSQLQQVQMMQQQLYRRQQQPMTLANDKKQTKRSPSTIDVIRSISFELGPEGFLKTHH